MLRWLILLSILCSSTAWAELQYRWTEEFGMGTLTASIRNDAGSAFSISCPSGKEDTSPIVEFESMRFKLRARETIQVVVDGESFSFSVSNNGNSFSRLRYEKLSARGTRMDLFRFVKALIVSRSENFIVEIPKLGRSERFSLKDASKKLQNGSETLVNRCI